MILQRAFEGRLVPQHPSDQPADKLLERIKAARQAKQTSKHQPRQQLLDI